MMNMLQKLHPRGGLVFDMYAEPALQMAACPDVFDGPEEKFPA